MQRLADADGGAPDEEWLSEWFNQAVAGAGAGRRLSAREQAFLDQIHGRRFPEARVHEGASAARAAEAISARGFTVGSDIFLPQRADLDSPEGAELLAHEAAHVDQGARADRGLALSQPGDLLERRAEAAGREGRALAGADPWGLSEAPLPDAAGQAVLFALEGALNDASSAAGDASEPAIMRKARRPGEALQALPESGGEPLSEEQRARFEAAFGRDLGHVRVHRDAEAVGAAEALSAHAFTVGSDIFFGEGEYAPGTPGGDRLLAHELTHVVQHDQGRLAGQGGVSSPSDASEQEAYANEQRVAGALSEAPAAEGDAASAYQGAPPAGAVQREASGGDGGDAGGSRGPTTTEEAAMGPLPSVAQDAQDEGAAEQPAAEVSAPEVESPALDAPAAQPAGEVAGQAGEDGGGSVAVDAVGAGASAGAPGEARLSPAPDLGYDIDTWIAHARAEGQRQFKAITAAGQAARQQIDAARQAAVDQARSRFAEARAQIDAEAAASTAAIDARLQTGLAAVDASVQGEQARLGEGFASRLETARAANDASGAQLDAAAEAEASRAQAETAARVSAAQSLSEETGGGGEEPLASGRADIASRVSEESAAQAEQTGRDTAEEVRGVAEARRGGLDDFLEAFVGALEAAKAEAEAALETLASESRQALESEAQSAREGVASYREAGAQQLADQESQVLGWLGEQGEGEGEQAEAEAGARAGEVGEAYEQIAAQFEAAAPELREAVEDASPETLAEGGPALAAELSARWAEASARVEPAATTAVEALGKQAAEVEGGLASASEQAGASLAAITDGVTADLSAASDNFDQIAGIAEDQTRQTAAAGTDEALATADAAEAERAARTDAYVQETTEAMAGAVDAQLAWQDEQVEQARGEVAQGQEQLGGQYESLKSQAKSQGDGASSAVQRGWLGDLWDFFDDLADRVLEWFQEKLGKVLGNIIGGILWLIIEAVGVVVCAAAWRGAQVINLIWGFIWGETAIPGYGGGFFAFLGDLIAGVIVIGDVRDILKYLIINPLLGKGPWWFNLLMIGIAAIGIIPLFGDGLKAIVKQMFKSGVKSALKELAEIIGEEIAKKLIKEVGEEAAKELAEELVEKVGKELAQKLVKDMTGQAARELIEEVGAKTVKRLLEEVSGPVIKSLYDDLGQEALEKLARTLGGSAIEQLNKDLGPDALKSLLTGLRGVTIKEYVDTLGKDTVKQLAKGLDGYAVKELVDELSEATLKALTRDLDGAAIKALKEALGKETLTSLASKLDGAVIKKLVDDLGGDAVKKLITELTEDTFVKLAKDLDGAAIKQLVDDLTGPVVKDLAGDLSGKAIKELVQQCGANAVKVLTPALKGKGMQALAKLDFFKFAPQMDAMLKAGKGAAVRALPDLRGKTIAEVQSILTNAGFTRSNVNAGTEFWTHVDHSIVRLKFGAPAIPDITGRMESVIKEISKVAGDTSKKKVFAKVAENGSVVPAGTNFAKDQLTQWFKKQVGRAPSADELNALMDVWGRSGHIDIVP